MHDGKRIAIFFYRTGGQMTFALAAKRLCDFACACFAFIFAGKRKLFWLRKIYS